MSTDVEMTEASKETTVPAAKTDSPQDVQALVYGDLQKHVAKIKITAETKELRHLQRALRHTFANLRKKLTPRILSALVKKNITDFGYRASLLEYLQSAPQSGDAMEVEEPKTPNQDALNVSIGANEVAPEVEIFIHLLVVVFVLDNKQVGTAARAVEDLLTKLEAHNRRTLDPLSSKVFFFYSRVAELQNRLADIRPKLLALFRTSSLRHNYDGHTTLLNLLLRNYLHYNLYDQADKLISKSELKEESASSNELARFYYYQGRIKAVQLNYTEAFTSLQQAIRKAPQYSAPAFRSAATKLSVLVQLLMGDVPERSLFRTKGIVSSLKPYLEITKSVRVGDLQGFQKTVDTYSNVFKTDKNYNLVQRMRNNVIKTGLRRISVSYSRISFDDICQKLNLESRQDAENIVAKAIKDGIIDATIDHAGGFIQSKENLDVYTTQEPQVAFHRRIRFCLDINNESVKAMRYPQQAKKEADEEAARLAKEEQEVTVALEEDLDDDDDGDFF